MKKISIFLFWEYISYSKTVHWKTIYNLAKFDNIQSWFKIMQILGFVNQSPVQQRKEKKMIYKKYKEREKGAILRCKLLISIVI